MTLIEAMNTNKFFSKPIYDGEAICYFLSKTGPFAYLVDCDYFVLKSKYTEGIGDFSTSIDLYPEEIMATDYFTIDITDWV